MIELTITIDNFEQEVLKSDKPVIVDFWAPWCGPCQMMGPVIKELSEEADGKYIVGKINIDEEAALAERFNIMSIPTIKIFKDGKEVASSLGVVSKGKIKEMMML